MIVVSDPSPIRAFAFLEQLTVLERLFVTVVIPPAVVDELAHPARLAGAWCHSVPRAFSCVPSEPASFAKSGPS